MQPHYRSDGIIGDYCDASQNKSIPLFQDNEHNLQIVMFYDEMELTSKISHHYILFSYRSAIQWGLKQVFTN